MIAPKGPGHTVRWEYQNGQGVPALFAIEQDASGNGRGLAMAYAKGIGGTRAGGRRYAREAGRGGHGSLDLVNNRALGGF